MRRRMQADERALGLVDAILKLPGDRFEAAGRLWGRLATCIGELEVAVKGNPELSNELRSIAARLESTASKLARSKTAASGPLAEDWKRFATIDLEALKDELLALQEFIVEERDALRLGLRRSKLWELGEVDPERLFNELHEAGAVSQRKWALLMAHPASLRKVKDREVSERLRRLAGLLFELQEVRSGGGKKR